MFTINLLTLLYRALLSNVNCRFLFLMTLKRLTAIMFCNAKFKDAEQKGFLQVWIWAFGFQIDILTST